MVADSREGAQGEGGALWGMVVWGGFLGEVAPAASLRRERQEGKERETGKGRTHLGRKGPKSCGLEAGCGYI